MKLVVGLAICVVFVGLATTERIKRQQDDDALIEKYPFIVAITFNGNFAGQGVIVSGWWILSTATVFEIPDPANAYRVYAGSANYKSGSTEHVVDLIVKHPEYKPPNTANNIAMARLVNILQESNVLQSVHLATDDVPSVSTLMVTFGGRETLLEVPTKLESDPSCISKIPLEDDREMVSGGFGYCVTIEPWYSVGPNDLGAPCMSMNLLYGLYADGSVATRIALHGRWIQSTIYDNK